MSLIACLYKDYLLRQKGYWVPLINFRLREFWIFIGYVIVRSLVQSHMTYTSINGIPKSISLNIDMIFYMKMLNNWSFNKSLS